MFYISNMASGFPYIVSGIYTIRSSVITDNDQS